MAAARRSSWRPAIAGAIAMLLLLLVLTALIVLGGLYPVAASRRDPAGVGALLGESMERGVKRAAKGLQGPTLAAADVREGGSHFKGMCQQCHGGPGVEPEEFATAMNPQPPDLARAQAEWSREEIFWIAKNGIKMSGMPAFGRTDEDEELWKVAAFVKSLPNISAADYASMPNAHEHEEAGEAGEKHGDKGHHSH